MKIKFKQSGLTLTEMTVVIVVIALLTAFSMPAVRTFFSSMATSGGTRSLISASLASARAIAAREQSYAGIRFQKVYDPNGLLNASQYMIFIVHDFDKTGLANGFRAAEGIQPIKLPDSVGVMDLRLRTNPSPVYSGDEPIGDNFDIDEPNEVRDTTAFSIIFSPSGKMVIHNVRVRNRDGKTNDTSEDDIFNTIFNVEAAKIAMFIQDDYADLGLGQESSRSGFIIYEKDRFRQAYDRGLAWSDYLSRLKAIHINPYMGTIISVD